MPAMYLNHISLTTGAQTCSDIAVVSDSMMGLLKPWLQDAIARGTVITVPPELASDDYSVHALEIKGSLVCTIFRDDERLVTFGVSARTRHGPPLWSLMLERYGCKTGVTAPKAPWCAHFLHADIEEFSGPAWRIERALAWAWIQKNKV